MKESKDMGVINIGYGNYIKTDKVICVVAPDSAPIRRMVQTAKDEGKAIDATCGKKTKSVIIMDHYMLILSALVPETIANRLKQDGA